MNKALPYVFWSSVAGVVVSFGMALYIAVINPPPSVGDYEKFDSPVAAPVEPETTEAVPATSN